MLDYLLEHIWLILFVIWGLPLTYYRSKFRKMVYQTESWTINIKPVFVKEIKGLFGNLFPGNAAYKKFRNFYRFYLFIYFVLFFFYFDVHQIILDKNTNMAQKINVGSTIPDFLLNDQNGQVFHLQTVLGTKNLVIYFYPKDDTPGCTKEACSFRDQFEVFEEADAMIIGISAQSVESHKQFAQKHRLNYTLLSDEGNKVRQLFGVPTNLFGLIPGRVTYVIDKTGKVVFMFNSQFQAEKHVDETLRILQEMK